MPSAPRARAAAGLLGSGESEAQGVSAAQDPARPPGGNPLRGSASGTRRPAALGALPPSAGWRGRGTASLGVPPLPPPPPPAPAPRRRPRDPSSEFPRTSGLLPSSPPPLGFGPRTAPSSPLLLCALRTRAKFGARPGKEPPVRGLGRASLSSPGISRSLSGSSPLCLPRPRPPRAPAATAALRQRAPRRAAARLRPAGRGSSLVAVTDRAPKKLTRGFPGSSVSGSALLRAGAAHPRPRGGTGLKPETSAPPPAPTSHSSEGKRDLRAQSSRSDAGRRAQGFPDSSTQGGRWSPSRRQASSARRKGQRVQGLWVGLWDFLIRRVPGHGPAAGSLCPVTARWAAWTQGEGQSDPIALPPKADPEVPWTSSPSTLQ